MTNPQPPASSDWAASPPPPPRQPPPPTQPPGWYQDPWGISNWRWYDGRGWTAHVDQPAPVLNPATDIVTGPNSTPNKPRLPSWLSVPVLIAAVPSIGLLLFALFTRPLAALLGLTTIFIVGPVLLWMDRLEPEPWSSKIHTFLWGAFVAGFISLVFNTIFATFTSESLAAVISAPFIEEITKTAAILYMVRRHEVDGLMDGLVYAGWSALGFASVENVSFFFLALEEDMLVQTFVGRALFTPFAHPLFTAWAGLAIGIAVRRRAPLWTAVWGLLVAMGLHAAWNGSLVIAETENGMIITVLVLLGFVALFFLTAIGVIVLRRREEKRYHALAPAIAARYGLPLDRTQLLLDRIGRMTVRKTLGSKEERQRFDAEASAITRLAAMLDHDGLGAPEHEARLVSALAMARGTDTP